MALEPTDRTMPDSHDATLDLLSGLIDKARRAGADAADAVLYDSTSISISHRLGQLEHVERSESGDLGLRVFIGKRMAIVSSSHRPPPGRAGRDRRARRRHGQGGAGGPLLRPRRPGRAGDRAAGARPGRPG